ncbi:unnamed protein product [Heligmosomoides polygyrus]|uniref:Transposase n=1 Tax=Heligmosomoides polygyrus TaxID=6339 RepID=A0A183G9R3_HELPZ|nr:unnamed protein product [Heligmosomoides polygyrus]
MGGVRLFRQLGDNQKNEPTRLIRPLFGHSHPVLARHFWGPGVAVSWKARSVGVSVSMGLLTRPVQRDGTEITSARRGTACVRVTDNDELLSAGRHFVRSGGLKREWALRCLRTKLGCNSGEITQATEAYNPSVKRTGGTG